MRPCAGPQAPGLEWEAEKVPCREHISACILVLGAPASLYGPLGAVKCCPSTVGAQPGRPEQGLDFSPQRAPCVAYKLYNSIQLDSQPWEYVRLKAFMLAFEILMKTVAPFPRE